MATGFAGHHGTLDHLAEIVPFRVTEHPLEITRKPKFHAGLELGMDELFEFREEFGDDGFLHGRGSWINFPESGK